MSLNTIIKEIKLKYIKDKKELLYKLISPLFVDKEGLKDIKNKTRKEMIASIPKGSKVLEIGPFYCPLIEKDSGYDIKFFDVLNIEELYARAIEWGMSTEKIPSVIDYISPTGDLTIVNEKFDYIISSHNIEHHPDLINHLNIVENLLVDGGKFIVIIPDKRFTYDHFFNASSIAEIIDAHINKAVKHSLANIINHKLLHTHNKLVRHFSGTHGIQPNLADLKDELNNVIDEYLNSEKYIDVHAWIFTPRSFKDNIDTLKKLGYINLELKEVTMPIYKKTFDFCAMLEKSM